MQQTAGTVVVIATGGTIAGQAASPDEQLDYVSARLGVDELLSALALPRDLTIEAEQLAQVDSKDMTFALWRGLAVQVAHHLARHDVAGVVVTHGTDTMEETAWFLARTVTPGKPVVLTGAMLPATSRAADGPSNLAAALRLAAHRQAVPGVVVVMAGEVHAARDVRKACSHRPAAFSSGELGPIGRIVDGAPRPLRLARGVARVLDPAHVPADEALWPWVEIVASSAGVDGRTVELLVAAGVDGIVVAATGNGTVHARMEPALRRARAAGVAVLRSTRCLHGGIVEGAVQTAAQAGPEGTEALESAADLSPHQGRVELIVRLLAAGATPRRG